MYCKAIFNSIIQNYKINAVFIIILILMGYIEKEGFPSVPIIDYLIQVINHQNLFVGLILNLFEGVFYISGVAIIFTMYFQRILHTELSKSFKLYFRAELLILIYYFSFFIICYYFNFQLNFEQEMTVNNIIFNSIDGICTILGGILIGGGIIGILNKEKFGISQIKNHMKSDTAKLYFCVFFIYVILRSLIQNFIGIFFNTDPIFPSTMTSFMLNYQFNQYKVIAEIILKAIVIMIIFNSVATNRKREDI